MLNRKPGKTRNKVLKLNLRTITNDANSNNKKEEEKMITEDTNPIHIDPNVIIVNYGDQSQLSPSTQPNLQSNKRQNSPDTEVSNKRYLLDNSTLLSANRYYLPDQINNEPTPDITQDNQNKIKIPPIYLHNATDYQRVIADISQTVKEDFSTNYRGKFLRVNLTNINDYRNLTKFYTENQIKFHTFKNPDDDKIEVIIRNLPTSISEQEIEEQLRDKKFQVIKVTRMRNKEKKPLPLAVIQLPKNGNVPDIYNVTKLCYCIVTVEPRHKTNKIPQCYRCQRFGHTKNYCQLDPRCVKCTGNHLFSECPKQPKEKPQCVNCGENHPANYRGCSYLTKTLEKLNQRSKNSNTVPQTRTESSQPQQPKKAWFTKPNLPEPTENATNPSNDTNNTLNSFVQTIVTLITPYWNTIKNFVMSIISNLFNNEHK